LQLLAERLGLETILGAFLAGVMVGLVDRDAASHPHFRTKLEAIGYGFSSRCSSSAVVSVWI
jgi:Kef-type K+ transport system membrane component KefB